MHDVDFYIREELFETTYFLFYGTCDPVVQFNETIDIIELCTYELYNRVASM